MESLLNSLSQETPSPGAGREAEEKAAPAPAQPTTGQMTQNVNDVPLTMAETDGIRTAIERNWLIPVGIAYAETAPVSLRLYLAPDGIVTKIEVLDDTGDPGFRTIAECATRDPDDAGPTRPAAHSAGQVQSDSYRALAGKTDLRAAGWLLKIARRLTGLLAALVLVAVSFGARAEGQSTMIYAPR